MLPFRNVHSRCAVPFATFLIMVFALRDSVAADDLQDAKVQDAVRLSVDEFSLNGKTFPKTFDADRLRVLKASCCALAREIAELRLSIGELRCSLEDAERDARHVITENAAEAVPFACRQFLFNAVAQISDGDDSLERTLQDSLNLVHSVDELRQEAVEHQQIQALTQYALLTAEDELRQTLISAMNAKEHSEHKATDLTTNWAADAKRGVMQMKITNNTDNTFKNVLIVVDVDMNQELLNSTEAGSMVLAGGLSLLLGIDPEEDQSLMVIQRKCGMINQGGTAWVTEWPAGQVLELPVCGIGAFLSRAQAATLSIASSNFTFVDRPVAIHTAVELAERKIAAFQAELSETAKRDTSKRERVEARQRRQGR